MSPLLFLAEAATGTPISTYWLVGLVLGANYHARSILTAKRQDVFVWSALHMLILFVGAGLAGILQIFVLNSMATDHLLPLAFAAGVATAHSGAVFCFRRFKKFGNDLPASSASPIQSPRYYIYQNDFQTGPLSIQDLKQMMKQGNISPTAKYCFEGSNRWQPISNLLTLLSK